jgi:hypothetical protein
MPNSMRLSALGLMLLLASSAVAVELADSYVVIVERKCQRAEEGVVHFDFDQHTYEYAVKRGRTVAGTFSFTCKGAIQFEGDLAVWGIGRIDEDAAIRFGGDETCDDRVRMAPKPGVAIWPFSCLW